MYVYEVTIKVVLEKWIPALIYAFDVCTDISINIIFILLNLRSGRLQYYY